MTASGESISGLSSSTPGSSVSAGIAAVAGFISGSKWNDLNENGLWETGEPGLAGWTIYLDANDNNQLDVGEVSTVTDTAGFYRFSNLAPGGYIVAEVPQSGWQQSFPLSFDRQIQSLATDVASYDLSGNKVAWTTRIDSEVYLYDGSTTRQLTDGVYGKGNPQISGNNVVWTGGDGTDTDIYLYDGSTIRPLTDNSSDDFAPQISGNNVVWFGGTNTREVFFYDGSTTRQLTDNTINEDRLQISGNNVLWWNPDLRNFSLYDGNTIRSIASANGNEIPSAQLSDNNVVWMEKGGPGFSRDYEIYLYDGSTTRQLTRNGTDDYRPAISGSNVTWYGFDGNDWEIYLYDGSTTRQLTNNTTDDYFPAISGSNVVWCGFDGNDWEIYLYDGSTTRPLTDNTTDDIGPQILGNNVTWLNGTYIPDSAPLNNLNILGLGPTHRVQLDPSETIANLNFGNRQAVINGTSSADSLTGSEFADTLNGLDGDDTLRGLGGNDLLVGGRGNDRVYGDLGNDRVIGGENSDRLEGGKGDDTLIGVNAADVSPGINEVDRLKGNEDRDLFVLGDTLKAYYQDGNPSNAGLRDYALIVDFALGVDTIQLRGQASDYQLAASPLRPQDTRVFLKTGNTNELIGVIRNVTVSQLSLDSSAFRYV